MSAFCNCSAVINCIICGFPVLVVALYKDGKLVDTKTENISQETSITLDKLGLNADNSDMVKAMIFKDLNSLEPLSVSSWK